MSVVPILASVVTTRLSMNIAICIVLYVCLFAGLCPLVDDIYMLRWLQALDDDFHQAIDEDCILLIRTVFWDCFNLCVSDDALAWHCVGTSRSSHRAMELKPPFYTRRVWSGWVWSACWKMHTSIQDSGPSIRTNDDLLPSTMHQVCIEDTELDMASWTWLAKHQFPNVPGRLACITTHLL